MHTFKVILFRNLRMAAFATGLAMFVFFAYKASNDVSSTNIAAGNQRRQTVSIVNGRGSAFSSNALSEAATNKALIVNTQANQSSDNHAGSQPVINDDQRVGLKAAKKDKAADTTNIKGRSKAAVTD